MVIVLDIKSFFLNNLSWSATGGCHDLGASASHDLSVEQSCTPLRRYTVLPSQQQQFVLVSVLYCRTAGLIGGMVALLQDGSGRRSRPF